MRKSRLCLAVALAFAFVFAGCENKTYNEYYNNEGTSVPTRNCWEYLSSQSDLSTFCSMLQKTGYDKVLAQNTSFTVWAPVNSALTDVDTEDLQEVTELVLTHISRFAYSTSASREASDKVTLLSGKVISFVGMDFGGVSLKEANINVKNGLVHTINGHAVYKPNLWEMTMRLDRLDSIGSYLSSLSKEEFSALLSTEIGTNAFGQPIYDSVFIEANHFLDEVADIDYEDTIFTVLFPDNDAWTEYYSYIKDYYVTREADGGVAEQQAKAREAMVNDLVFSGYVDLDNLPDSLETTTGEVLYNVDELFKDVELYECSNGYMYVSSKLAIDPADTWLQPVKIEAENASWGRTFGNAVLYTRSSIGKAFTASKDAYLEAEVSADASTLSKIYVEFPIPNLLSATYNIYCVFMPECISESKSRPCSVSFELTYRDADESMVENKSIKSKMSTDGTKIDTVYVGQHTFSFCNLYDRETSTLSDISTRLRVRNQQRKATTKLTNVIRPDYIVFEPVLKNDETK